MDRVFESGAAGSPPSAPASPSSGYPTAGNPQTATPATKPGPWWYHMMSEEVVNVIEDAGLIPDHEAVNQLSLAIQSLISAAFTGYATPPQFDNDTSLATTAFVQRALGSLSGFATINSNVTLTAAHAGRGCYLSAAAIATLPLANTVPAGTLIYFTSMTSGATSVARQGGDTIAANSTNSALTSMVILDGDDLLLESNGNTQWIAVGGSARLKYSGGLNASIAANGWHKLPSGLLVQWGTTPVSSAAGAVATSFPIAFPSNLYSLIVFIGTGTGSYFSRADLSSLSGFDYSAYNSSTTARYAGATSWFVAIGK